MSDLHVFLALSDSDEFFMEIKVIKFLISENTLKSTFSTSTKASFPCWSNLKYVHTFWHSWSQSCDALRPKYSEWLQRHRKSHANILNLYPYKNRSPCWEFDRNWNYLTFPPRPQYIIQDNFYCLQWALGCIFNELCNFWYITATSYRILLKL